MKEIRSRYWLECIACSEKFPPNENHYTCPRCNGLFLVQRDEDFVAARVGTGEKARNYFDKIRYGVQRQKYPFDSGVWMWKSHLLPGFPWEAILSLREGRADLFELPEWLKKEIGLDRLFIKLTGQNPSESFKDYGMTVAVSMARWLQMNRPKLGIKFIACASTGDTSASAAQYAAYYRDKLRCIVFLPAEKFSNGQLTQVMMSGAIIMTIEHPQGFDGCMKLIKTYCSMHPEIVLVNSANAFRLVGQEAIALEIFQDLRWQAPDWISIPVGNGGNLTALLISCLRARTLGLIEHLPGIIVAQTKSANTIVRWINSGFQNYEPAKFQNTIASAMNIQNPVSFPRIRQFYKEFQLLTYDVSEEEIRQTRTRFNRAATNICPQGAVAVSAVLKARENNAIKKSDKVVAISTASGLKFIDSAMQHHFQGALQDYANPPLTEKTGTIKGIEELMQKHLRANKNIAS